MLHTQSWPSSWFVFASSCCGPNHGSKYRKEENIHDGGTYDTISRVENLDMPRYVLTLLSDAHEANEHLFFAFPEKPVVPTNIKSTLVYEKRKLKFDTDSEPIAIDSYASYSLAYKRDDFVADTIKEVHIPIKGLGNHFKISRNCKMGNSRKCSIYTAKCPSRGQLTFPIAIPTTLRAMCETDAW